MKIYTDKNVDIIENPRYVQGSKMPTHLVIKKGKKKDGTEFDVQLGAGWKHSDGTFGISFKKTDTGENGTVYTGYSVIKDTDIPSEAPSPQEGYDFSQF